MDSQETLRIAKYLARCGVASRRKAEAIIREGRVSVNGEIAQDLGRQIHSARDLVEVDGRKAELESWPLTLAMNKPTGVVVTRGDPQGRKTVYDILPPQYAPRASELVYAGRLDIMTSGLLILSTDGGLIQRLTHPRHHLAKTYEVETGTPLSADDLDRLRRGVELEDGLALPTKARELGPRRFEIVLTEGRNRQVRRMVEALGARVAQLRRTAVGGLRLDRLKLRKGEVRELDEREIGLYLSPGTD